MAVLRGTVRDATGAALPGVAVTVAAHPELGSTVTQGSGAFDIAVNGGQRFAFTLPCLGTCRSAARCSTVAGLCGGGRRDDEQVRPASHPGHLGCDRHPGRAWKHASGRRGRAASDGHGAAEHAGDDDAARWRYGASRDDDNPRDRVHRRRERAERDASASFAPERVHVCGRRRVDEAIDAGAAQVTFSQPLPFYVENFLGFPVGTAIPVGFYNTASGAWAASPNGNGVCLQNPKRKMAAWRRWTPLAMDKIPPPNWPLWGSRRWSYSSWPPRTR